MLAPFDGIVTGKYFENGELYTGAAFGGASKPSIIAIEKINPLKAYVNLAEQYYLAVQKGTKVQLKSNIYPTEHLMERLASFTRRSTPPQEHSR